MMKKTVINMRTKLVEEEELREKKQVDLNFFKDLLLGAKRRISEEQRRDHKRPLSVSEDDLADECDLANSVMEQQVQINLQQKKWEKICEIDLALQRVSNGSYGLCEECDEPISETRLQKRPWTTLCIVHAEEKEREKHKYNKIAA